MMNYHGLFFCLLGCLNLLSLLVFELSLVRGIQRWKVTYVVLSQEVSSFNEKRYVSNEYDTEKFPKFRDM